MAAVVTDTTEASYILKDIYEGPLVEQFNTGHKMLEKVERDPTEWSGARVVCPLEVGRNPTARSFGENTSLPESDTTDGTVAYITAAKIGGRFELTEDQIQASKTNRGAFVAAIEHQMKGLRESCRNTQHRQLYGNKIAVSGAYPTGIITQVNGGTSSATTAVFDDVRFIQKRKKYLIGTASEITGGSADLVTVTSINRSTKTVTFSAAKTLADDDIVTEGDGGDTSPYAYGREMNGINFAVSDLDDDFEGVNTDPASFGDEWKSYVADANGTPRNLSLELMNTVYDNVTDNSGSEPDLLCMHSSMLRQYELLLTPFMRFEPQKLEGGRKVVTYANGAAVTPIEVDRYCTLGSIYFLSMPDIKMFERKPWGFLERGGSVLRPVANKENWECVFTWAGNLGYKRRCSHGRLDDLNYNLDGV